MQIDFHAFPFQRRSLATKTHIHSFNEWDIVQRFRIEIWERESCGTIIINKNFWHVPKWLKLSHVTREEEEFMSPWYSVPSICAKSHKTFIINSVRQSWCAKPLTTKNCKLFTNNISAFNYDDNFEPTKFDKAINICRYANGQYCHLLPEKRRRVIVDIMTNQLQTISCKALKSKYAF